MWWLNRFVKYIGDPKWTQTSCLTILVINKMNKIPIYGQTYWWTIGARWSCASAAPRAVWWRSLWGPNCTGAPAAESRLGGWEVDASTKSISQVHIQLCVSSFFFLLFEKSWILSYFIHVNHDLFQLFDWLDMYVRKSSVFFVESIGAAGRNPGSWLCRCRGQGMPRDVQESHASLHPHLLNGPELDQPLPKKKLNCSKQESWALKNFERTNHFLTPPNYV